MGANTSNADRVTRSHRVHRHRQAQPAVRDVRRPCGPRDQRLRQRGEPDTQHRSDCPGGCASRQGVLHQLNLHAVESDHLTGTYSHVNGACSIYSELDYRVPPYSQVLRAAGYQTAIFGKWHLGVSPQARPRGFDDWRIFPGQGAYVDPVMYGPDG